MKPDGPTLRPETRGGLLVRTGNHDVHRPALALVVASRNKQTTVLRSVTALNSEDAVVGSVSRAPYDSVGHLGSVSVTQGRRTAGSGRCGIFETRIASKSSPCIIVDSI